MDPVVHTGTLESIPDYYSLSDHLATAGQPGADHFDLIARAGFQVVINLGLYNTEYALEDEEALVKGLGMGYLHIPVSWDNPAREDLEEFFTLMDAMRDRKVFVHCAANKRVSVFIALYRILRINWPFERAFRDVYAIWTPEPQWDEFITQTLDGHP
jgi:protein tyrosine phosphatase (PTP) superfamily phosphohydrolase (DUF442 family)